MPDDLPRGRLVLAALAAGWIGSAAAQSSAQDSAVAGVLRRAGITPTDAMVRGTDAKSREAAIDRLARSYPLPPELLNTRDRQPENPGAVIDRLGLTQRPGAARTDLSSSGNPPTAAAIFDALAPR